MRKIILAVAVITSFTVLSQGIDKVKLDTYFEVLASNNKFMGSVAVSQNGELIYTKSVGFSSVEHGLKANENTKYRIGSISKTFTAVMILKAIEENKLCLNQTIETFFPTIKNAEKITISHLLYHRSGVPEIMDNSWPNWHTQFKTEQEMTDMIASRGSEFEPGTKTSYSNPNYILLSFILQRIYDKPFSDILNEKIIRPLGLANTDFGGKINTENNESNSYQYVGGGWNIMPETDMSILSGTGGVVSTAIDLVLFSDALFSGKLLSENSLAQMKTVKNHFGMGIALMPFQDKVGFGHPGGIDGFRAKFVHFPDSNISVAYTSNGINYNHNAISAALLSAVFNKPFEIPEFTTNE